MGRPVVIPDVEVHDAEVSVRVSLDGPVEAGVVARWIHDRAYALLIDAEEALLVRYGIKDRFFLQRKPLPTRSDWWNLALSARDGRIRGRVEGGGEVLSLEATDADPFVPGAVGVVANPLSNERGGRAAFRLFRASSSDEPTRPPPTFVYRFAGGIVPEGDGVSVRLTARTVYPQPVGFEVARDEGFSDAIVVPPSPPEGSWGSVHGWARGLEPGEAYLWRPFTERNGERVNGTPARLRTPRSDAAVRFAFGSCTSGRTTDYASFATAASFEPEFYLHAGDWGYVNLNSLGHGPDHFQHRWARLLRTPEVGSLIEGAALMLWQDDHDYQADNGWAETVQPYTVWSFDEVHSNPTDTYFDVRWGDVHVWCLDCRLFASDPAAPDDASKTRLGEEQKSWLKDGMRASDAPVRIVASSMAFRNKVKDDPGWHNDYTTERDELLGYFASLPATVFILSGDSHGHRLIHHFEFGRLYEVTASGTDFPPTAAWGQGNNDPEHTLENVDDRTGFAVVELDPPGEGRRVTIRSIASASGSVMFEKSLPVRS